MRNRLLFICIFATGCTHIVAGELYQAGRDLFTKAASPSCAICHSLKDADAVGEIGPNLNDLKPTEEQVINVVTSGSGVMPSFSETLSPEQIRAVAHYVFKASRLE